MLAGLIEASVRLRTAVFIVLLALLAGGGYAVTRLPIDAVPDISTTQVSVLTDAPGLSSLEIERTVTFPIENALNGVPGMTQIRSVSRAGLSSVTVIFEDGTNAWLARQLVLERIRPIEPDLPASAAKPELGPLTTGLGEIFIFVVRSAIHSPMQLRTILDWEVVPRMRGVPGVIEVNTMGGKLKQFHVVADSARLKAHGLTLGALSESLRAANVNIGGGYIERGPEALTLRGVGVLTGVEDIENVVVGAGETGRAVLVRHVADVSVGAALPNGVVTRDGQGEVVQGVVMMLPGSNSRTVIRDLKERIEVIKGQLPPGVIIEAIYDRADFVERTVRTVVTNLLEGAAVVAVVLIVMLGSLRGAIVTTLGIPASMAIALFGMLATGTAGNLMSLGAIDFGFLVDGPIVMLEAVIAATAGRVLSRKERTRAFAEPIIRVGRPVAMSVAIIMLVYVPLLSLEGVEGKMFRPMAITMAFALFGALVYSVVFLPALVVLFMRPAGGHGHGLLDRLADRYARGVVRAIRLRYPLVLASAASLVVSGWLLANGGADFLPRIDEGDLNVTMRRSPSVGLAEARQLDLAAEKVLLGFPEVKTAVAVTGRAEVAVDPVGLDSTDIMVRLADKSEWKTAQDLDGLCVAYKTAVESQIAGTFVAVSQPIEDRTNALISGSRADVQILVYGSDLATLKKASDEIGAVVKGIQGTGDVRIERLLGAPELTVRVDRERLARYGARAEEVLAAVEAARVGIPLGWVYEGERKFGLRLLAPMRTPTPEALGDLFVEAQGGNQVPVSEVASVEETEGPAQIRRQNRSRTVRVDVNLRGRDLVSWVSEARAAVDKQVALPSGYTIAWGGQFENFERASKRLSIVASFALVIIFGMLIATFGDVRYAIAVFGVVPFAFSGGALGLFVRELPFSIPAAVGFIALAGVSVLNGVVVASEVKARIAAGSGPANALVRGSAATMRAVLTTGAVAALGFMPMALATGAGAEVQRPLATVVVFGIGLATLLTLFVLPGILRIALTLPGSKSDDDE